MNLELWTSKLKNKVALWWTTYNGDTVSTLPQTRKMCVCFAHYFPPLRQIWSFWLESEPFHTRLQMTQCTLEVTVPWHHETNRTASSDKNHALHSLAANSVQSQRESVKRQNRGGAQSTVKSAFVCWLVYESLPPHRNIKTKIWSEVKSVFWCSFEPEEKSEQEKKRWILLVLKYLLFYICFTNSSTLMFSLCLCFCLFVSSPHDWYSVCFEPVVLLKPQTDIVWLWSFAISSNTFHCNKR